MVAAVAMNTDAERQAKAIRLRAERKAGQLLTVIVKANRGSDKSDQGSHRATSETRTLDQFGVSGD